MSFVQREATLLAVLGPSGAGKTSLFSTLLGELPLQSGKLYFQKLSMKTQSRQIRERPWLRAAGHGAAHVADRDGHASIRLPAAQPHGATAPTRSTVCSGR